MLQLASVIQSYIILAFAFAVLATAHRFGTTPECNQKAFAVMLRPFSALKAGRILGWIVFDLAFTAYTSMTARDYLIQIRNKRTKNEPPKNVEEPSLPLQHPDTTFTRSPPRREQKTRTKVTPQRKATYLGQPTRNVDGQLLFKLIFILVAWALFVLNTELLIH